MRNVEIINKSSLKMKADEKLEKGFIPKQSELVGMVKPSDSNDLYSDMEKAENHASNRLKMSEKIIQYGGAFFIPKLCATATKEKGKKVYMSAFDMLQAGYFTNPKMTGNTLPTDWQTLWDALRIDISIRKAAQPTVRGNFYNVLNNPGASKIIDVTELYPYAFEFVLNNGEGQSVNQGETRGGQTETVEHFIYATGFTRTLLSELYDESYDPQKVIDGVMIAMNGKQDDLSISPILNFTYSGVTGSQTPADTTGANRQEKLFNTLENAIDHLARRSDPITDRKINASDLAVLCEPEDARHIQRIVNGLTTPDIGGQDEPKILPPISQISTIVAYDGEVIRGRVKDITYTGVTRGKCYLVKKNRYMNISIKRGLQLEVDNQPDVTTLARQKRSWYFAEGQQTTGIQYFVQEVTLPAYTPAPS
jgi:hypothetical protein